MSSINYAMQRFNIYGNIAILATGLVSSCIMIFVFMKVRTYRKTPSTYYFLVASFHDAGALIADLGPIAVSGILNVDLNRVSLVWCKLRFFLASSLSAIPLSCITLAVIDQCIVTSNSVTIRNCSSIKIARCASIIIMILWWLHGIPWLINRQISPITGLCFYADSRFTVYASIFIFGILCGCHIATMILFSLLTYRNIQKTTVLSQRKIDRQVLLMVWCQVALIIVGLIPYGITVTYTFITSNLTKTDDRKLQEALVSSVTYTFCHIIYGVCSED